MKNDKSLGQHWLKNRAILDTIADLALMNTQEHSLCIEIGPGLGTLTSSLLKRFDRVVAIEFDQRLAQNLPQSFPGKALDVIQGDILKVDLAALTADQPFVVAGNIPYYITSPIIRTLLALQPPAQKIVLLVQKEVAERVAAVNGKHSLLSLTTQNHAIVELGPIVPAAEFTPPPKVDSAVLILTPRVEAQISPAALELAQRGFTSPRKKLAHNLAGIHQRPKQDWEQLLSKRIGTNARAEDLSFADWQWLSEQL